MCKRYSQQEESCECVERSPLKVTLQGKVALSQQEIRKSMTDQQLIDCEYCEKKI